MNKQEKLVVMILSGLLIAYMGWQYIQPKPVAPVAPPAAAQVATAQSTTISAIAATPIQAPVAIDANEQLAVLKNDEIVVRISTNGGVVRNVELCDYKQENTADSACVILALRDAFALKGIEGIPENAPYAIVKKDDNSITLSARSDRMMINRNISLAPGYLVKVTDTFSMLLGVTPSGAPTLPPYTMSAGSMPMTNDEGEVLSADNFPLADKKPNLREGKLTEAFGASSGFLGCAGAPNSVGFPMQAEQQLIGAQNWVALKTRFFISALLPSSNTTGGRFVFDRDPAAQKLTVNTVSATIDFAGGAMSAPIVRTATLYAGPKKYELLSALGNKLDDTMEFGFFSWFCKLLLPTLNFFHDKVYANYGIAIILLTFLVRMLFWPLTHKSTVSMKKMQTIQPQLKELQKAYKGNPQKIQQETMKLYRENKVNPLASCLPMLIQIPIFIALFTVLRSAVELRFADFLWIADLSQPENLFASVLPMPLNILPILTAVTMGLQTHLTPGTGDPAQKKMMTWMMPIMLLFMFYTMASALCLYWTVSQVLSIIQMLWIQRSTKHS